MRKGDIVLVPFPFTDLSGQKVRPALALYAGKGEDCIVAFISSKPRIKQRSHDVAVLPSRKNGLKYDSFVKLEKIATLQRKTVIGKLGTLEGKLLETVNAKLRDLFSL